MTKIAIIGTHFVGKTTLVKKLSKHIKNVQVIDEVVRSCPYPVNEMATIEAQDWILNEQRRREEEAKADVILTDRGLIDNFAYWQRVAEKFLTNDEIQRKKKEVFEYSKNYDLIIFLEPFESKIKNDNFRSVNEDWRKEMHDRIFSILNEFKERYPGKIYFLKGDEKEVFNEAINILKELKII